MAAFEAAGCYRDGVGSVAIMALPYPAIWDGWTVEDGRGGEVGSGAEGMGHDCRLLSWWW